MADYGILLAARNALKKSESLMESGIQDAIYLTLPPEHLFPLIVLELEEIWTSMRMGDASAHVRVKFKTSIVTDTPSSLDAIHIADAVRKIMDGQTMSVKDGMNATLRLAGSVIDLPDPKKPRSVQQYYEAIIRG